MEQFQKNAVVRVSFLSLALLATVNAVAPDTNQSNSCELHVFPGVGVGVVDATQVRIEQGVLGNVVRDSVLNLFRIKDPKAAEAILREALSPIYQSSMLNSIDYQATPKGKGRRIIVHDQSTNDVTIYNFKKQKRTADSTSQCYSELVISGTYFEKSTLQKTLKTSYFFRDFGAGNAPDRAVFKGQGSRISNFPPKNEAEASAAVSDIRSKARQHIITILNKK